MPEAIQFRQPARRLERRRIINDTTIRSIKPPANAAVAYFDDVTPGLFLRITANDVRTWTVFYRDKNARQKRLALGRYPAVKLVDARELARNAQRSVAHGADPALEKRAAREVLSFSALAGKYIDGYGAQEYESPLLVLTSEYDVMRFQDMHDRLCDALRGERPRLTLQIFVPGSAPKLAFDDGSTTVVPSDEEPEE